MQSVDIEEFTNSPGWKIIHNPGTFMYEIKADNGVTKPGSYTNKRMAEKALYDYLSEATAHAKKASVKAHAKNKTKKVEPKKPADEKIAAQGLTLAVN